MLLVSLRSFGLCSLLTVAVLAAEPGAPQSSAPPPPTPSVVDSPLALDPAGPPASVIPARASKPSVPPTDAPHSPDVSSPPGVVPQRWPDSRYRDLREHSPFALATAAAPPPAPEHNFAEGLKLKGVGYSEDKNGKTVPVVWVQSAPSAANKVEFELDGNEPGTGDGAGISVAKINESPEWGKTTVELKKGVEVATIEYDQMEVQPAPPPVRPGVYRPAGAPAPGHPIPHPSPRPGPQIRSGAGYSPTGRSSSGLPPVRVISGS